jgi:hypothetical protein
MFTKRTREIKMVFRFRFGNKSSKEKRHNKTLTWERLNEVLYIDSDKGECYWKIAKAIRIKISDRAGTIIKKSNSKNLCYRLIVIDSKQYREHIIIWFFVHKKWPTRDLDHKDRDGLNNKYKNLRLCTNSQNQGNTIEQKNNTSGYKGVSWHKHSKKWRAGISYKRKRIWSKGYNDPYEAYQWYCREHNKLFGEFSRTG